MVTVADLLDACGQACQLTVVAGEAGRSNPITLPRIQKPGLALAGYLAQIHPDRVQVVGNAELGFLEALAPETARSAVDGVFAQRVACLIVTNAAPAPSHFVAAAASHRVPLLVTPLRTAELIRGVTDWLEDRLAPRTLLHGVLVEVFGVGVLLLGRSGIGKSEAALDLVARGHRLVADDVVEARALGAGRVLGSGAELIRHHMEIRGLGIINVQDLFGILATLKEKQIQLVAEMLEWPREEPADRLGLEDETHAILGVALPKVRIPIRPGRSVATIIEVAARNYVLKSLGRHTAREFAARVDVEIARRQRQRALACALGPVPDRREVSPPDDPPDGPAGARRP